METSDQARAPATQPFGAEAFGPLRRDGLRWLGMAGFLVNSRGTTIMIDPLLGGFDMPIMIELPVSAGDVPHLDALLVTHSDNDHYSVPTCRDLAEVTDAFHSTRYVASLDAAEGPAIEVTTSATSSTSDRCGSRSPPPTTPGRTRHPEPAPASSATRTVAGSGSPRRTEPSGHRATHASSPTTT